MLIRESYCSRLEDLAKGFLVKKCHYGAANGWLGELICSIHLGKMSRLRSAGAAEQASGVVMKFTLSTMIVRPQEFSEWMLWSAVWNLRVTC